MFILRGSTRYAALVASAEEDEKTEGQKEVWFRRFCNEGHLHRAILTILAI